MYSIRQLKTIYKRIGLEYCDKISVENLYTLHKAFSFNIPYETLNPLNGIEIKLDEESLYNKMILNMRGGYCFEVCGLFSRILLSLGFEAYNHLAWVLISDEEFEDENMPAPRHHVITVKIDGEIYLCDVGFGRLGIVEPAKLITGKHFINHYQEFVLEEDERMGIKLIAIRGKKRTPLFAFRENERRFFADFVPGNFYCNYNKNLFFTNKLLVSISFENGKYMLNGDEFKTIIEGKIKETTKVKEENLKRVLMKYFKIEYL